MFFRQYFFNLFVDKIRQPISNEAAAQSAKTNILFIFCRMTAFREIYQDKRACLTHLIRQSKNIFLRKNFAS
jgi:hypothetical protein